MAFKQASEADYFERTLLPDWPGASIRFKPTGACYLFRFVANRAELERTGPVAPGCEVTREVADPGEYDEAQIENEARRQAVALADKLFRGA
jgi:hypothetical protein